MKILTLSDQECPALYDHYIPGRLKDYDLIISCGDLKANYLSFIVTMARVPVLYVHGNHDTGYERNPPEGCDCIDDQLIVYNGLRILGLGGCRMYRPGQHQYTEKDMRKRIRKLKFKLWWHKGVDIVVTHAPPKGVGDDDDPAHRGFEAFLQLIPYTAMAAMIFPGIWTTDPARPVIGIAGGVTAALLAWKKCPVMVCVLAAIAVDFVLYLVQ